MTTNDSLGLGGFGASAINGGFGVGPGGGARIGGGGAGRRVGGGGGVVAAEAEEGRRRRWWRRRRGGGRGGGGRGNRNQRRGPFNGQYANFGNRRRTQSQYTGSVSLTAKNSVLNAAPFSLNGVAFAEALSATNN